jgi:hypothetical protein
VVLPQQPPRQPQGAITGEATQPLDEARKPKVMPKAPQGEISPKIIEGRALGLKRVPGVGPSKRRQRFVDTSTAEGVQRASSPEVVNLLPDQDFGPLASAKREIAARESLEDYRRLVSKAAGQLPVGDALTAPDAPGMVTGNLALPYLSKQYYDDEASKLLQSEWDRRSPRDIGKYDITQEFLKQAKELNISLTEKDLENLVDWGIVNTAANKIIALSDDNNIIGIKNVYATLEQTSPVMASILPQVLEEKIIESIEDPEIIKKITETALGALTPLLAPFVAANEWMMEGVRAATVEDNALAFLSGDARKAVQEGNYDADYIQQIKDSGNYSDLQISIALEVARRNAMGHPDPIFSLYTEEYLGDEEAAAIIQEILLGKRDSQMQELMRQIDSASLGNTGQVILSSFRDEDYTEVRGEKWYQNLANITGFGYSIVADPTLFGTAAYRSVQAARWALTRLAPGSGETAEQVIRKMKLGRFDINTRTSRLFDEFTKDLNKLDELQKTFDGAETAAQQAAALSALSGFRTRLTRQYRSYFDDDVIDEFIKYGRDADTSKYSIESAAKYIDNSNQAYIVSRGQIADDLAAMGATVDEIPALVQQALNKANIKPLYARIGAQNQKRVPLTPGMTIVGALRKNAVNGIIAGLMPEDRAIALLSRYIDSFDDTGEFSQQLSTKALEIGKDTRKTKFFTGEGWFDSIGRMFSSISIARSVAVDQASDAQTIYRWARQFFPKRTSEILTQQWRAAGSEGQRRLMLSGMIRSAAASRGMYMSQEQADTWVRQLSEGAKRLGTGTRPGEQYGVAVPNGVLPTERAQLVAQVAARKAQTRKDMKAAGATKEDIDDALRAIDDELEVPEDAVYRSLSADSDGIESAMHMYQASKNVALPSLRDFEQLRGDLKFGLVPWGRPRQHLSNTAQAITDYWSVWTLFGLRFSLRNAVEEVGLYWLIGGPRAFFDFVKGRQLDQAVRSVRPRIYVKLAKAEGGVRVPKLDKDGVPIVVYKSDLGMFANKVEWLRRRTTQSWRDQGKDGALQKKVKEALDEWEKHKGFRHWMAEMILPATRYDDSLMAIQEFAKGNPEAFAALATKAMIARKTRSPLAAIALSGDDEVAFDYAVNSIHGMALLDEIGEAAAYLNAGGFPAFTRAANGISDELAGIPGVSFGKIGPRGAVTGRLSGYGNVTPIQRSQATNENIWGVSFWWRELQHTLDGDGVMGVTALQGVRGVMNGKLTVEQAKANLAKAIRDDDTFGYRAKLSQLSTDAGIDDFADRYFENVFQHFTKADGSVNKKLVNQFFDKDGTYLGWWDEVGPGEITPRISMADLKSFDVADRPAFVFGREIDNTPYIPFAETLPALFSQNRNWIWMGAQNARISRAPIFWGNYSNQFSQTAGARKGLAEAMARSRGREVTDIDIKIANDEFARWSLDNAYNLTLSYVDNPANRSNLAWKARNVSRYYRAQEDFYRRMVRVAKNNPEAYWKAALIYQSLDDTGFVYKDDQGNKYFAYPGNELLQDVVASVSSKYFGIDISTYMDLDPFIIGGKVTGIAPSTDPNQQAPTLTGPTLGAPAVAVFNAFPSLAGLRSAVLGSYSQQTGSWWDDFVNTLLPAGFVRALRVADPEQVEASLAQSAFDTVAIMASQGMLNKLTITTSEGTREINGVDVTYATFRTTDQYKMAQSIAAGNWITKQILSWTAAAAPQTYVNNVSDFARMSGIVDAKAARRRMTDILFDPKYLELVEKHADGPNPLAVAGAEWYKLKFEEANEDGSFGIDSLTPLTLSKYKWDPSRPNLEFMSLNITNEWMDWEKSDKSKMLERNGFEDVKRFLAPRTGEFSFVAWSLATNVLGLKVPKNDAERIEEIFSVTGQARDNMIRRTYEKLIAETNDPDLQKEYRERSKSDRDEAAYADPAWDTMRNRFNSAERKSIATQAVRRVEQMLNFIDKSDGSLNEVETSLRNAINIFKYYEGQKSGLRGSRTEVKNAKDRIDLEMERALDQVKSQSEQAKIFVEGVIETATYKDQYFNLGEK